MIYVLIVVANINGGVTIATQEFSTLERCKVASEFIEKSGNHIRGSSFSKNHMTVTCVLK